MSGARPSRLLMMVWDGMRPDLVSAELTPNLAALAATGTTFAANHAVIPTVTRVNAATLATGAPPAAHGLPANLVFAPVLDGRAPISLGEGDTVAALMTAYGLFAAPTIADVVHANGGRTAIVSSGTRGSAQMLHPRRRAAGDLIVHPTLSGDDELAPIEARLGPLPAAAVPDTARNRWLARAAAEIVIPETRPDVLVVWHDDPDKSQHLYGLGHPASLQAIRDADAHLGLLLASLEAAGLRQETLVAVVSDHGYVGTREHVDVAGMLVGAFEGERVIVAPNGCSVLVYLDGERERPVARAARRLAGQPGIGVLFSGARGAAVVDGTAPLHALGIDGPLAPNLLVTFDWSDEPNEYGHRGVSGEHGSGNRASHGGASSWEVRNLMILAGPGIRAGGHVQAPSGNQDLAPTVLTSLGLPIPTSMTGRVLADAFDPLSPGSTAAGDLAEAPRTSVQRVGGPPGSGALHWSMYAGHCYLDAARR